MKKVCLLLATLSLAACQHGPSDQAGRSGGYQLTGTLTHAQPGIWLYLREQRGTQLAYPDSVRLDATGRFTLRGQVAEPTVCGLTPDKKQDVLLVPLENGRQVQLTADLRRPGDTEQLSGSAAAEELQQFLAVRARYEAAAAELQQRPEGAPEAGPAPWNRLWRTFTTHTLRLVRPRPASFVAAYLADYLKANPELHASIDSLTTRFSQTLPASRYTKALLLHRNVWRATTLGQQAPELVLPGLDGRPRRLSSLRGQYVLLDFWASWCGPCRQQNPHMLALYRRYHAKGWEIYGISLDDSRRKWAAAVAADQLPWPQGSDLKAWQGEAAQNYAVVSIPHTVLLDRAGRIIALDVRGAELDKQLARLLP